MSKEIFQNRVSFLPSVGKPNYIYYVPNGQGTDLDCYVADKNGVLRQVKPILPTAGAETDPIWLSEKSLYLTTATATSTYQPIGTYATASNTMTFTNKSGSISQWTNDSGYLTSFSETDPVWLADKASYLTIASAASTYSLLGHTHTFASLTSKPTTLSGYGIIDAYPLVGNPSGFLTTFSESDPIYTASTWFSTTNNSSNWNTAFGWGNHGTQGYITASSTNTLTNKSGNISQWTNDSGYLTTTGITPSALTKADDTNVTLTLGGIPNTSLLQPVSLTLGWTGTLADGRIASATIWNAKQNAITTGTTLEYFRGDLSLATFPTTTASFISSTNKNFVTDAQLIVIGNTSGTNTGDQTSVSGNAGTATALATTRKINGVNFDGTADIGVTNKFLAYAALGSTIVAMNVDGDLASGTSGQALVDARVYFLAVYLDKAQTLTGVKWVQITAGDYTADAYNGVGLYTYSGGTLTLVASSTNDGNIWKATTGTMGSKAFSATYAASAGLYFVAFLYNNSAQVTAPSLGIINTTSSVNTITDFTNSARTSALLSTQSALPTPQTMSGTTAASTEYKAFLY